MVQNIYIYICVCARACTGTSSNNSWIRHLWACHNCLPKPAINPIHNPWEGRLYCFSMEEIFLWPSSPSPWKAILWTPAHVFPFLLSHIHAQKAVHTILSWPCVRLVKIIFASLFLLLFMDFTALFGTIHESYYTISANFYLYLPYFQQKVCSFSKISVSQTDPPSPISTLVLCTKELWSLLSTVRLPRNGLWRLGMQVQVRLRYIVQSF